MKGPPTLDQITLEKLQEIEPEVRYVATSVGEDHNGDPAVKITILVGNDVPDEAFAGGRFRPLLDWILKKIWDEGGNDYWPYTRIVRENEAEEAGITVAGR